MPYIQHASRPGALREGRQVRNASYEADTSANWVGEVDAIEAGDTEITEDQYKAALATNEQHNGAIPEPKPTPPLLVAKADLTELRAATTIAQLKTALEALL